MLIQIPYDRDRAVAYAKKWAKDRNPLFYDFTGQGGNCTNFVSQCLYVGCGIMNFTPTFGWYYRSPDDRAPAWTGVEELYRFLTGEGGFPASNSREGPYGVDARIARTAELGDIVQLANDSGSFYHSLLITGLTEDDVLVSAQSNDALDRPLSTYNFTTMRILHIQGALLNWDVAARTERIFQGLPATAEPGNDAP